MAKTDVFWVESARADLYRAIDPLRLAAPKRAVKLIAKLMKAVQQLADFPESGRKPLGLTGDEQLREVIVEQLRLFYTYSPAVERIDVIAVFHARQDVAELLRARLKLR